MDLRFENGEVNDESDQGDDQKEKYLDLFNDRRKDHALRVETGCFKQRTHFTFLRILFVYFAR